jgi:hypothetical protein
VSGTMAIGVLIHGQGADVSGVVHEQGSWMVGSRQDPYVNACLAMCKATTVSTWPGRTAGVVALSSVDAVAA